MSANIGLFFNAQPVHREHVIKAAKWWGTYHCATEKTNLRYKPGDTFGYCKKHNRMERILESRYWETAHCPDDGTNLAYPKDAFQTSCTWCGQVVSLTGETKWSGQKL